MVESLNICNQIIYKITKFNKSYFKNYKNNDQSFDQITTITPHNVLKYLNLKNWNQNNIKSNYNTMESLINHFKYWSEGFTVKPNWTHQSVESPKGEFGVSLISDGTNKPYRCKVRSPAYHHMQLVPEISKGHFLADMVAVIGTVDIVFGEVDR